MYCTSCGRAMPPEASFCPGCGNRVHVQVPAGDLPQEPPAPPIAPATRSPVQPAIQTVTSVPAAAPQTRAEASANPDNPVNAVASAVARTVLAWITGGFLPGVTALSFSTNKALTRPSGKHRFVILLDQNGKPVLRCMAEGKRGTRITVSAAPEGSPAIFTIEPKLNALLWIVDCVISAPDGTEIGHLAWNGSPNVAGWILRMPDGSILNIKEDVGVLVHTGRILSSGGWTRSGFTLQSLILTTEDREIGRIVMSSAGFRTKNYSLAGFDQIEQLYDPRLIIAAIAMQMIGLRL